jgi:acyloxyacyl hydrolase
MEICFSIEPELRGSSWRGKDCNDLDSSMYPGRKSTSYGPQIDHNCNGIYAINNIDYEKIYCEGTGQRGVIIVGDSAGAHFHIPPEYINASAINEDTYDDLLFVISNEFDWPELSSSTGYIPSTPGVPVKSFYLNLRERNLCNHRDYQNIARNGLRSGSSVEMAETLSRSKDADQPVVLTFELVGNDVCSPHPDFTHFTDPTVFKNNLLEVLGNFSLTLPNNSYVLFMGLAKGSILWDLMHNRTHPLGTTYAEVYGLLNCLQISPCWTWMNSNQTVRETGDAWAQKLSTIYDEVIATTSYPNFKMIYYPFPFEQIIEIWEAQGGQAWQLIEPVDGFHPNQISNSITADWMWDDMLKNHPEILGDVNPNNAKIQALFGDQGGY